jgi:3-isopropylmalate/(R)-2-methylmalate dehydratase small subunit
VDLEAQSVTSPSGRQYAFASPETLRNMLLDGVDEIDLTLRKGEDIERFRAGDRTRRPWAY